MTLRIGFPNLVSKPTNKGLENEMSDHGYNCGCAQCDAEDLAAEAREEFITDEATTRSVKLMGSEDFAWGALVDLSREAKDVVLQDVGRFFEKFHNEDDDRTFSLAQIAGDLYRDLKPFIETAADSQARDEVAAEYDAAQAADDMPRSEAEYRQELAA